jgi:hypothetical protein
MRLLEFFFCLFWTKPTTGCSTVPFWSRYCHARSDTLSELIETTTNLMAGQPVIVQYYSHSVQQCTAQCRSGLGTAMPDLRNRHTLSELSESNCDRISYSVTYCSKSPLQQQNVAKKHKMRTLRLCRIRSAREICAVALNNPNNDPENSEGRSKDFYNQDLNKKR